MDFGFISLNFYSSSVLWRFFSSGNLRYAFLALKIEYKSSRKIATMQCFVLSVTKLTLRENENGLAYCAQKIRLTKIVLLSDVRYAEIKVSFVSHSQIFRFVKQFALYSVSSFNLQFEVLVAFGL